MRRALGVLACSVVTGLAVACSGGGSAAQATTTPTHDEATPIPAATSPAPEPDQTSFVLDPQDPLPGQPFTASFDAANRRGGYFVLTHWDGSGWSAGRFLLESDVNGRLSTIPMSGEHLVDDYGVAGPGPDGLLMPEELASGIWRLCTVNAADEVCAQFIVG